MSTDPRRRSGPRGFVGATGRQTPVEAHEGTHWDFLRRLELSMRNAAQAGPGVLLYLASQLIKWAADPRNILCAIESLAKNGDTAAGLDGVRLRSLTRRERRYLLREIPRAIKELYRPWPRRREDIPKEGRSGTRPIEIANAFDRVMERALYQILSPFLDHLLGPNCLGSRRRISREAALITAQQIADRENRHVWLFEDLRDAFTKVINPRLRQILISADLPENIVDKTFVMLGEHRERGIPQGSPLSGLLLNVYLTFTLERPWKRRHPNVPLLWVVDDLLLLTGPDDDPVALYQELRDLVESAGMQLKGTPETAICRLDQGERGQWLGYEIAQANRQPRYRLGEKTFRKLCDRLVRCHQEDNPPQAAREVLIGWLNQSGAAYEQTYAGQVFARVISMVQELGLWELLSNEEFLGHWHQAYARYRSLRRVLSRRANAGLPRGSAPQDASSANFGRGGGDSVAAAPPPSSRTSPMYRIWTDGSSLGNPGIGGWAYHVENPRGQFVAQACGSRLRATNNRMELLAVVMALQSIPNPASVQVFTDSQYVERGLREFLPRWLAEPNEIRIRKNGRLWLQLAEQCQRHRVRCTWTPGHSGNTNNELVDHLARNAALELTSLPGGTQHQTTEAPPITAPTT
jgi:ribonuclease HI